MIIKGTVNVELDSDQLDEVIVNALMIDYGHLAKDVQVLANRSDLKDYERKDLEHNLMLMQAIDRVMSNYMLHHEHQIFRKSWSESVFLYKDRNFNHE